MNELLEILNELRPDIDFSKTIVVGDSFADRLFANRINAKFILV